jgi:hypothetical protein
MLLNELNHLFDWCWLGQARKVANDAIVLLDLMFADGRRQENNGSILELGVPP